MKNASYPNSQNAFGVRQRGISLIMVMLIMMLVALTTLSASRSSYFNESVTSNEADYNRAYLAAEALISDAQLDISAATPAILPNFKGDRPSVTAIETQAQPFFPGLVNGKIDYDSLRDALSPNLCVQGICAPNGVWPANALPDNFWANPTTLAFYTSNDRPAWYGRFTGAAPGATGNPILTAINPRRAWYWVEVLEYSNKFCLASGCSVTIDATAPFIYRITAVALGRGNTIAVIQTYYAPTPRP